MKPPFTYFGGKTAIADRIAALLPPHQHYVEPFAGSLAVLLAKPPSSAETVNDLEARLMTFWRVLRDQPDELDRACTLTPHSRAEYDAAWTPAADDLEQARRVWVLLSQGRSRSLLEDARGWRYRQAARGPDDSVPLSITQNAARIRAAAERIRLVSLECRPALQFIRTYGRHESVLIYADPPYLVSARTRNDPRYACEATTETEHRELLGELLSCRAAVVLSGYASDLYDGLLGTWSRREIATQTCNGGDRTRTEVVWSNRPFPQGSLFDLEEPL